MSIQLRRYLFAVLILLLFGAEAAGQAKVRKLSTVINHPSLNLYAPYISADANAVVFLSDNAEDHVLTPFFSYRERGDWQEPKVLPKILHTRLNFLRGYGLSADGSKLYFSTLKGPGVGGFDICMSEWRGGSSWTNPVNLGAPINTRSHEACPSITPDGKTLYFMRCDQMDQNTAGACKIFRVDKKSNGLWGEPEALPETINTGNSQTPRIMADAETLIFSSDKMAGSKGGMDLYVTTLRNGTWSTPVPLDFVNTEGHDQYVSVTGLGRYLLRDSPGARKSELVEYLIPDHIRPKGMTKVVGKVTDETGKPLQAYVSLLDIETGKRVYNGRPDGSGSFLLYAREGSRYELAIDPEHGNKTFFTKTLDLTVDPIPQVEKVEAVLKPVMAGDEWTLNDVAFEPHSAVLNLDSSQRELQRVARMISSNPGLAFEVNVLFEGYREDSLRFDPDLTEVRLDTIPGVYVDIDTLGQLYERDTATVRTVFHNDRTSRQVQSIIEQLVSKGAPEGSLQGHGEATPALLPENRATVIRLRAFKK